MVRELDSLFISKNIDEQSIKVNNDFLNKNEALEKYLNFYSSQNLYTEPVNFESSTLDIVELNNLCIDKESNIFNNMELNNINEVDMNNLNTIEINNVDSLCDNIKASCGSAAIFNEHKHDNISTPSGNIHDCEKYFNLRQNSEYYENEHINDMETNGNEENHNLEIVNESKNIIIEDEEHFEKKEKELNDQINFKSLNEDQNIKDNLELNISDSFPLSDACKKNEIMYNECALTNDFFKTIENINTKVLEKYNNLKDTTENLIDIINKSQFEKRINNLLDLSDKNSELIDKFKNKSEECIRQCRKFETTSENLIGECINTLAQTSICYAEWACLHSFKIDPIDNDLNDIKLFIESSQ